MDQISGRRSVPASFQSAATARGRGHFSGRIKGVNLAWVSDRLGHTDVRMTKDVYAHVLPEAHSGPGDATDRGQEGGALSAVACCTACRNTQ